MKKIFALLIICVLLLTTLLSCTGRKNNSSGSTSNSTITNTSISLNNSSLAISNSQSIQEGVNNSNSYGETSAIIGSSSIEGLNSSNSISSSTISSSENSSVIEPEPEPTLPSYVLTVDPESEAHYLIVTLQVEGNEVTGAEIGQEVTVVVTTSDRIHRSLGIVIINGITVFDCTDTTNFPNSEYKQTVTATAIMVEGGIDIQVTLVLQSSNS